MPEIKFEVDEITYNVIQKNNEIWQKNSLSTYNGAKSAVINDIWTGWMGLLTTTVLNHPTWKWPFWVREQTRLGSPGYIPIGHSWGSGPTFNQRYISFTMVGLRDKFDEPVIGLDGAIMPRKNAHSVTFWLYEEGKLLGIGESGKIKQELESGYLPIVKTSWNLKDKSLVLETFADEHNNFDFCFTKAEINNKSNKPKNIVLFVVVTPWGPDNFHPISKLEYSEKINGFIADNNIAVLFDGIPDSFTCSNYNSGDVCVDAFDGKLSMIKNSGCNVGYCSGAAAFNIAIKPGGKESRYVKIPIASTTVIAKEKIKKLNSYPFKTSINKVAKEWNDILNTGMNIEISADKLTSDTYKAGIVNLHLLKDGSIITPGPLLYHGQWIRDAAHQLMGLDTAGFHEAVGECLESFFELLQPDGYVYYSTANQVTRDVNQMEYDSNGQAIWMMVEHYKLIKNKKWLEKAYPFIKKAAKFIIKIRKSTCKKKDVGTLHYGLMPESWSAEHTGPTGYVYYDDFWGLCGLKEAKEAAEVFSLEKDIKIYDKNYRDFEKCIWDSINKVIEDRNLECFPASTTQDVTSTIIGNIACFWPCKLVDPFNKRFSEVLNVLYSKFMPNGCWYHDTLWSAYGPILSWSVANCFLYRSEFEKVLRIYDWTLKNCQTSTHTIAEGVNAQTMYGGEGDGYGGWGTAEYIMLLRNMLLLEKDNQVWIMPCIPDNWLKDGSTINVSNMPTSYGTVNFKVKTDINSVDIELALEGEAPKNGYVITINPPGHKNIKSVVLNSKKWTNINDNKITVPKDAKIIEVKF